MYFYILMKTMVLVRGTLIENTKKQVLKPVSPVKDDYRQISAIGRLLTLHQYNYQKA